MEFVGYLVFFLLGLGFGIAGTILWAVCVAATESKKEDQVIANMEQFDNNKRA